MEDGMASESESEVAQLCPTLCDPMDYSPPGSSIHGIFQARVLEWVAIAFSKALSIIRQMGKYYFPPHRGWSEDKAASSKASLVAQLVKNLPAMRETWV